jgi:hypothetical protein
MGRSSREGREARRLRELEAAKAPEKPIPQAPRFKRLRAYRSGIVKAIPLGVFLPMMIFFGSVGPDDYAKNYAAWARKFGLSDWADWLNQHLNGPRVFWGTIFICLTYLVIAFAIPWLIRRTKTDTAAVVIPIVVAAIVLLAVLGLYSFNEPVERHVTAAQRASLN